MTKLEIIAVTFIALFFTFLISVGVGSYKEAKEFNKNCQKLGGKYYRTKHDRLCIKQESILEAK